MSTIKVNTITANTGQTVQIQDTVLTSGGTVAAANITTSGTLDANGLFTSQAITDNGTSVAIATPMTATSVTASGAVACASLASSGAITTATVVASGQVSAGTLVAANTITINGKVITSTSPAIIRGWVRLNLTYHTSGAYLDGAANYPNYGLSAVSYSFLTITLTVGGAASDGSKMIAFCQDDNSSGSATNVYPRAVFSGNTVVVTVNAVTAAASQPTRTILMFITNANDA